MPGDLAKVVLEHYPIFPDIALIEALDDAS